MWITWYGKQCTIKTYKCETCWRFFMYAIYLICFYYWCFHHRWHYSHCLAYSFCYSLPLSIIFLSKFKVTKEHSSAHNLSVLPRSSWLQLSSASPKTLSSISLAQNFFPGFGAIFPTFHCFSLSRWINKLNSSFSHKSFLAN